MGSTGTAFAATSTDQLIAQLQAQIADLTAKLNALKKAQADVKNTQQNIDGTLGLINNLGEGMTGDQVKQLQAALALDPSIFPKSMISGYYGKYTRDAVKKYLKKHGHDSCFEYKWDKKRGWRFNQSNRSECRKGDNDRDDRGGRGHGTTTPPTTDTTAPVISSITVTGISTTGATINWSTNEVATSKIYTSTTSPVSTSSATWTDSALLLAHGVNLVGLSTSTTYYYVIEATDAASNKTLSAQGTFVTAAAPDVTAPVLSSIVGNATGSTTANVAWSTNESANSKVFYGTTNPLVLSSASSTADASLVLSHSMNLSGLMGSTTYYAIVTSSDVANNTATSSQISFTTPQ